MNINRLRQLSAYIESKNTTEIDFQEAFRSDFKILGLDEFPHDEAYLRQFFELNSVDFETLFIPKDRSILTIEDYLIHLNEFINGVDQV